MRGALALAAALAAACLGSCGQEPERARGLSVSLEEMRLSELPEGPVEGTLAGRPFVARDARYFVVKSQGPERVDLLLAERPIEHCGVPLQNDDRRVLLRFGGKTRLEPGEVRVGPGARSETTIHYEVPVEGRFHGRTGGAALVRIEAVELGTATGRLHVCFDDGGSCVAGRFRALECRSKLSVDMAGERHTKTRDEQSEATP